MKEFFKLRLLAPAILLCGVQLHIAYAQPADGQVANTNAVTTPKAISAPITSVGGQDAHSGGGPNESPPPAAPISDFIRFPDIDAPQLSPDGKNIAAIVPTPDRPFENLLAILDAQTLKVQNVIRSGRDVSITSFLWLSNDRLLLSPAFRAGQLDGAFPTGELFSINKDGTNSKEIFGFRSRLFVESGNVGGGFLGRMPNDDVHILVASNSLGFSSTPSNTGINIVDTKTGLLHWIGTGPVPGAGIVADHMGQARAAVASSDSLHARLWLRADNSAPWTLVNDPDQSKISMLPIGFSRDSSKLYVEVTHAGQPNAIELLDPKTMQRVVLFQGKFANASALIPTADGLDYYAVISQDGKKELHYFDERSTEAQLNMALSANFPGQLAYFSSFSRDGKHAIVTVSSDRNPGDFYSFDLNTHQAHYLASAMPWIKSQQMHSMQPIELKARDGLTLHGFLTLPSDTAKPYPLVVLVHGGPYQVSDEWEFDGDTQLLASRGYAVLRVNFRGSSDFGDWFEALGFKQWGHAMQDDLTDATRWAITQGYADPKRVCIYGGSYGGYAALEGTVREPNLYKCAIGFSGVYDLRVQMNDSDAKHTDEGEAYLHNIYNTEPTALLNDSPLSGVSRIQADILLLHGGSDSRVPYKNFREMTSALDHEGKRYETVVELKEGHGFFLPENRQNAYEKIMAFLDRNIGDSRTPETAKTAMNP